MSLLIDVGQVLRGSVCELYSNLLTRPTGAAVRHAIEQQVVEVGAPVVTTIDFSQVDLLDVSCADEIVAKLLLRYDGADPLSGYLLFKGIREDHLEAIDAVLEKRSLALVAWHDGLAELHGIVDEDERLYWEVVRDLGPISANRVAYEVGSEESIATHQLTRLYNRRLIMIGDERFIVPGMVGPFT
ncbi:MAG: hypothetical protein M3Y64_06025 [Gemmatimonadota bacterium]|nr:hypothetical protein [Gemmatimonadota bacterium]